MYKATAIIPRLVENYKNSMYHIFYINNVHLNIFITSFDVQITRICQLAVELGSTDRESRNYLKARALLVVILSLMKAKQSYELRDVKESTFSGQSTHRWWHQLWSAPQKHYFSASVPHLC
jgi:hypothetical protein